MIRYKYEVRGLRTAVIFLIIISLGSCTVKGKVNQGRVLNVSPHDSVKSLKYYNEGSKYYNKFFNTNQLEVLDSSVYFLEKSILNNKKKISSYEMLITILILKKDFHDAENIIDEAIQYTSQKAYYTAKKGLIKNKLNQIDSARYYFNIALQKYYKKEQNLDIKNQIISILYQMGNKKESLKVLNDCIRDYPKDSVTLKEMKKMIINNRIPR